MSKALKVIAGTPDNPLVIGDIEIPCFVLEDDTRVIARAAVLKAIGRTGKAKGGRQYDAEFKTPVFLTAENLKPFISNELIENSEPVVFSYNGQRMIGYRAEFLPQVCEVFLDAKEENAIKPNQQHIAAACKVLYRGFATVGIIALIDEATGYQRIREERALATILEKFIDKELNPWTRTFPYAFYKELYRLRGWDGPVGHKRTHQVAHDTNDIVYERLAPGVLEELKKRNPTVTPGRRKSRHHQWFTPDFGHPKLKEHLAGVMALMRAAPNWTVFYRNLQRAYQKYNETTPLALDDD